MGFLVLCFFLIAHFSYFILIILTGYWTGCYFEDSVSAVLITTLVASPAFPFVVFPYPDLVAGEPDDRPIGPMIASAVPTFIISWFLMVGGITPWSDFRTSCRFAELLKKDAEVMRFLDLKTADPSPEVICDAIENAVMYDYQDNYEQEKRFRKQIPLAVEKNELPQTVISWKESELKHIALKRFVEENGRYPRVGEAYK